MTQSTASRLPGIRSSGRSPYRGPTQVDSSGTSGVVQVMGRTSTASGDLTPILRRPSEAYQIPIRFSGQGGDFFRIWIVNVLLTILTLSLYRPWARVRTLRYFYGQTRVDGFPLDFHGDPWKMLRGHVLVTLLMLGYVVGGEVSPIAQGIGAVALLLLGPALFRASMQFRLAHTSWRGMRFGFTGTLRGIYLLLAPPVAISILVGVAAVFLPRQAAAIAAGVGGLLYLALVPWFFWALKSYQQDNLAYAELRAELRTGAGSFYGIFVRAALLALLLGGLVAGLIYMGSVLMGDTLTVAAKSAGDLKDAQVQARAAAFGLAFAVVVLLFPFVQVPVRAYYTSRMQDLVWSRTGSRVFRFKSELPARRLMGLMLKNVVLTVLTLGLYYPFAKVELMRMRLQAVTLVSRTSLDELVNLAQARPGDAAGDAAGDALGMDFGA